jgi:hypothetical protein
MEAPGISSASFTASGPSDAVSRATAALAIAGVAWLAAGVVWFANPEYWSPVTAIDYAAVGLYSLALLTTAVALALLERLDAVRTHALARVALLGSSIGGIVAGVANFGEDWLHLSPLSSVYVGGVVLFYLCMVAAGAVLAARSRELRWLGALLIIPFPAPLLDQALGFIVGGAAFIACAALLGRSYAANRVLS